MIDIRNHGGSYGGSGGYNKFKPLPIEKTVFEKTGILSIYPNQTVSNMRLVFVDESYLYGYMHGGSTIWKIDKVTGAVVTTYTINAVYTIHGAIYDPIDKVWYLAGYHNQQAISYLIKSNFTTIISTSNALTNNTANSIDFIDGHVLMVVNSSNLYRFEKNSINGSSGVLFSISGNAGRILYDPLTTMYHLGNGSSYELRNRNFGFISRVTNVFFSSPDRTFSMNRDYTAVYIGNGAMFRKVNITGPTAVIVWTISLPVALFNGSCNTFSRDGYIYILSSEGTILKVDDVTGAYSYVLKIPTVMSSLQTAIFDRFEESFISVIYVGTAPYLSKTTDKIKIK